MKTPELQLICEASEDLDYIYLLGLISLNHVLGLSIGAKLIVLDSISDWGSDFDFDSDLRYGFNSTLYRARILIVVLSLALPKNSVHTVISRSSLCYGFHSSLGC